MSIFDKRADKQKRFLEASEGQPEEKKRDIEEALLKPEKIPAYTGELPANKNDLEARSVLIVFKDKAQMDLVGNLLKISKSKMTGNRYITDISMLEHIAKRVRNGSLIIKNNKIMVPKKVKPHSDPNAG